MTHYELYVIDSQGRSSSWSHTNGHRGKVCMVFDADKDQTMILDHPTMTTYFFISKSGAVDILTEPKELPPKPKRRRPRRKR